MTSIGRPAARPPILGPVITHRVQYGRQIQYNTIQYISLTIVQKLTCLRTSLYLPTSILNLTYSASNMKLPNNSLSLSITLPLVLTTAWSKTSATSHTRAAPAAISFTTAGISLRVRRLGLSAVAKVWKMYRHTAEIAEYNLCYTYIDPNVVWLVLYIP